VHPRLARRLGSVVIGFPALEVIASSDQPLFVAGFCAEESCERARIVPDSFRSRPSKDRFQSVDSPGQIFVQSLRAGFCPPQFPQERWRRTPQFAIDRDDRGPSQAGVERARWPNSIG
jgi:hypothetical protein